MAEVKTGGYRQSWSDDIRVVDGRN